MGLYKDDREKQQQSMMLRQHGQGSGVRFWISIQSFNL